MKVYEYWFRTQSIIRRPSSACPWPFEGLELILPEFPLVHKADRNYGFNVFYNYDGYCKQYCDGYCGKLRYFFGGFSQGPGLIWHRRLMTAWGPPVTGLFCWLSYAYLYLPVYRRTWQINLPGSEPTQASGWLLMDPRRVPIGVMSIFLKKIKKQMDIAMSMRWEVLGFVGDIIGYIRSIFLFFFLRHMSHSLTGRVVLRNTIFIPRSELRVNV